MALLAETMAHLMDHRILATSIVAKSIIGANCNTDSNLTTDYLETRVWIMFYRVRIADSVLVGNFLKIHFQAFPSSLYTRKRCLSTECDGIFFLEFEPSLSSIQHPSSSVLGSGISV